MHTKRQTIKKTWPIKRKGTKFVVVPLNNKRNGIPLLVVMRDILKIVNNRKELKQILNKNEIKINNKIIKDERWSLLLFDVIKIEKAEKEYQISISKKGKIKIQETKNKNSKISKIIGKKILKNQRIQINLSDGRNLIVKENLKIGDSIVFNFVEGKVEKVLELKEKAQVLVVGGRHIGEKGQIIGLKENTAKIKLEYGEFEIQKQNLIVVA